MAHNTRPHFRLSGADLIELIRMGDEASIAEARFRSNPKVQRALREHEARPQAPATTLAQAQSAAGLAYVAAYDANPDHPVKAAERAYAQAILDFLAQAPVAPVAALPTAPVKLPREAVKAADRVGTRGRKAWREVAGTPKHPAKTAAWHMALQQTLAEAPEDQRYERSAWFWNAYKAVRALQRENHITDLDFAGMTEEQIAASCVAAD